MSSEYEPQCNRNSYERRRIRSRQRSIRFPFLFRFAAECDNSRRYVSRQKVLAMAELWFIICSQKLYGVINVHQRNRKRNYPPQVWFILQIFRSLLQLTSILNILSNIHTWTGIHHRGYSILYTVCTCTVPHITMSIPIEKHKWQQIAYLTRLTFQCLPPVSYAYGEQCSSPRCVRETIERASLYIVWQRFVCVCVWPLCYFNDCRFTEISTDCWMYFCPFHFRCSLDERKRQQISTV